MNLDDYQRWTSSTATYPEVDQQTERELNYCVLGLAGEAGEVAGALKKAIRKGTVKLDANVYASGLPTEVIDKIIDECGDTLWYLARVAKTLGISLSELADINVAKLEKRLASGEIVNRQELCSSITWDSSQRAQGICRLPKDHTGQHVYSHLGSR